MRVERAGMSTRLDLRALVLPEFLRRLEIIAGLNGRTVEAEAAHLLHRAIMPNATRAAELASVDLEKMAART